MIEWIRRWRHLLKYAQYLSILNYIVNDGGRVTIYAKGLTVMLEDNEDDEAYRVAIGYEGATPYSVTLHSHYGKAMQDLMQSAKDIQESRRFLGDGDEQMAVKQ